MLSLRRQATCALRRSQARSAPTSRWYATETKAPEEGLNLAFYIAIGAIPASMLVYGLSRPDKNGDAPALTKWIASWANQAEEWERINTKHTATVEQAARDKHLFFNVEANPHIELKFPEQFQTGSPYNVPAGHSVNLEKVMAHYKKQHLDEEARKARIPSKRKESQE